MKINNVSNFSNNNLSFDAMKKNQFIGADRLCVEKFKAPIEKFNTNEDLQNWAGKKLSEIMERDFKGRTQGTRNQRNVLRNVWFNYLKNLKDSTNALMLIVMHAFTKNLGVFDDNLPPVFNKNIFEEILDKLKQGQDLNIEKIYQNRLFNYFVGDNNVEGANWIIIPSKIHDSENFTTNFEKLQTLSNKNWCTRNYYAIKYLEDGDFHLLMGEKSAIIGVRFVGDKVEQIQGPENNGEIPLKYFEEVVNHLKKYKKLDYAQEEIDETNKVFKYLQKCRKDLRKAIENKDYIKIFDYFGMLPLDVSRKLKIQKFNPINIFRKNKHHDNENIVLRYYSQPTIPKDDLPIRFIYGTTFRDMGIDEKELFKSVTKIELDADFRGSTLESLENLKEIGGNAIFSLSNIQDLGELTSIGGDANFENSKVSNLKNLKYVGGSILSDNSGLSVAQIMKFNEDNYLNK